MSDVTMIACCDEHGLHGERTECFVCGGPVEQVPMVHARESERVRRLRWGLQIVANGAGMPCEGRWLGVMAGAVLDADTRLAGEHSDAPTIPCPTAGCDFPAGHEAKHPCGRKVNEDQAEENSRLREQVAELEAAVRELRPLERGMAIVSAGALHQLVRCAEPKDAEDHMAVDVAKKACDVAYESAESTLCPRCHGRRKIEHGELCEGTYSEEPCPRCAAPESGARNDRPHGQNQNGEGVTR